MNEPTVVIKGRLLARNTLLNLIGQGVPLLIAIGTMPLVIRDLGPARFGILALGWALLNYFSMFDLGLGRAATKFAAEAFGRGEAEQVGTIALITATAQAALGVIGGAVLVGLTPLLLKHILTDVSGKLIVDARWSFYLLSIAVPATLVAGSFRGVLEAAQRFDLINAVRAPSSAANFLLPFIGVLFQWSLPEIIGGLVISVWVTAVAQYAICRHLFPALRRASYFNWVEIQRLIRYGGWVTVSTVVSPILVYLDRFIVGAAMSVSAVGYYAAPHEMATRLLIIPASLVATLFPALSTLSGQQQHAKSGALVARSLKHLLLLLGPCIVIVIVCASPILAVWLGPAYAVRSAVPLQILAIGVLINSAAYVPYALLQARGRPDLTAKFHLLELPVHLLVLGTLVQLWGLVGAALAWSIRVTLDAVVLYTAAYRLSWISPRSLMAGNVPQTALLLAVLGAFGVIEVALVNTAWVRLSLLGITLITFAVVAWYRLLDDEDRSHFFALLRPIGERVAKQAPASGEQ